LSSIKWGIYLRQPEWNVDQLQGFVEHAEELGGYHGIYTNDHLTGFDKKVVGKEPYLEAWTFITAVLMWSKRLHAGHTVLCQSFRNPALLAKMVSSLDVLSKGRFDLFLGAGWKEDEYQAYGYPFPNPATRLHQLEEYVTIIRNLMDPSIDNWDFEGEFWAIKNNRNFPKPSTWPFPIHLGGNGPRFINMAARIAEGYNTGYNFSDSLKKFKKFDEAIKKLGDDPAKKVKSFFGGVRIFKDDEEAINLAKDMIKNNEKLSEKKPEEIVKDNPWGTPEILAEKISDFIAKSGVHYLILSFRSSYGNPLDVFWDEVRPLI
jgi:alkanesulfonate monooxygenase SsuD/methylene tetrahydromethanopterin reductase-like flavin-dependent oxidoreductase (luciferase family)